MKFSRKHETNETEAELQEKLVSGAGQEDAAQTEGGAGEPEQTEKASAAAPAPGRRSRGRGGKRLAEQKRAEKKAVARKAKADRQHRALFTPTHLRRRRLTKKELTVLLLPALATVLAAAVVILAVNRGSTCKLDTAGNQYYANNPGRIEAGAKLKRDQDSTVLITADGHRQEVSLPIYQEGNRKVTLPGDMIYYTPRDGEYGRLSYFTEVECKSNGMITVERGGKSTGGEPGFLYDGGDFYLFLEPMTVEFNGYRMELPALSYVEAVYRGQIMVFNYETKEFFMETSDGTGVAKAPGGDYEISLLGDSITLRDGSRSLLVTRPDLFDPIV